MYWPLIVVLTGTSPVAATTPSTLVDHAIAATTALVETSGVGQPYADRRHSGEARSGAVLFSALHANFIALQVLDVRTTWVGRRGGATEANPIVATVAGSAVGLITLKAATTATAIYCLERIRRQRRGAAMALALVVNAAAAAVVVHNTRQLSQRP
jgi:hypothetical protein